MPFEPNLASLVSYFGDFLTVAIHTIIFERHIYPLDTFITAKKWNTPVRQSRHPRVCKWIGDAVVAVQDELIKGTVNRVAVVIYSEYAQPLERFMFDLSKFPTVDRKELFTPIERESPLANKAAAPPPILSETEKPKPDYRQATINLEEQFRAVMIKLTMCDTLLSPIPQGCTFTVAIELKDEKDPPIGWPQAWIPCEPSLQREKGSQAGARTWSQDSEIGGSSFGSDLGGVSTTPIRSVESGEMVFEMWIEEGAAKNEMVASQLEAEKDKEHERQNEDY